MDRRNFKLFFNQNERYTILITNKHRNDSVLVNSKIISELNESETNLIKDGYSKLTDAYACLGVYHSASTIYLVVALNAEWITKLYDYDVFKLSNVRFIDLNGTNKDLDYNTTNVMKLLDSGNFYFAKGPKGTSVDISLNLQNSFSDKYKGTDLKFVWNKILLNPFHKFKIPDHWYNTLICGSFLANTVYAANGHIKLCLISRVACNRVGTRFQARGIDDNGYVANFVETEQLFVQSDSSQAVSFVQVRGSVPLFWEQQGLQVGAHKIKFSRLVEMSAVAYEKHFNQLVNNYSRVFIVNLLGNKEGERSLCQRYESSHKQSSKATDISYVHFDYHREMPTKSSSNIEKLKSKLREYVDECHFARMFNGELVQKQCGVVRTNCVDCLDRTNAVQGVLALDMKILQRQIEVMLPNHQLHHRTKFQAIFDSFKNMWKQNGDSVSQIYAGSAALGAGSKFIDAHQSVKRTYQANFSDSVKQVAMLDLLRPLNQLSRDKWMRLRQLVPLSILDKCEINNATMDRVLFDYREFSDIRNARIFVGTWNVNGGKNMSSITHKNQSMSDWLINLPELTRINNPDQFNSEMNFDVSTDIFAIGFEEIVDLTASNILNAKSLNQQQWAQRILQKINDLSKYVLVKSLQLVGICLLVYVKINLVPHISEVYTSSVKTGFKGTAGNKGAVAIRFRLFNSSLCFICSHFAAGQSNVKERNEDFAEICKKLHFQPEYCDIWCHDLVCWCGDFNYRIDMTNSEVKRLVAESNWQKLLEADQLTNQRALNAVFSGGFNEGQLAFAPTYKYDLYCDDYDTSEKCRVPAWTDRVLWRESNLLNLNGHNGPSTQLLLYNRAELKISDHRPVAAFFDFKLNFVDKVKCREYIRSMLKEQGPNDSAVKISVEGYSNANDIPKPLRDSVLNYVNQHGIILVRLIEEYIVVLYKVQRDVLDAIEHLNNTQLPDEQLTIQVSVNNANWHENIDAMIDFVDMCDSIDYTDKANYPSVLAELINTANQSLNLLDNPEIFSDDDNDDINDTKGYFLSTDKKPPRTRSCSPPVGHLARIARLNQYKENLAQTNQTLGIPGISTTLEINDQASSCSNLLETDKPKRPPPMRPPPFGSNVAPASNNEREMEADLLGLGIDEATFATSANDSAQVETTNILPEPLIPLKQDIDRPAPPPRVRRPDNNQVTNTPSQFMYNPEPIASNNNSPEKRALPPVPPPLVNKPDPVPRLPPRK